MGAPPAIGPPCTESMWVQLLPSQCPTYAESVPHTSSGPDPQKLVTVRLSSTPYIVHSMPSHRPTAPSPPLRLTPPTNDSSGPTTQRAPAVALGFPCASSSPVPGTARHATPSPSMTTPTGSLGISGTELLARSQMSCGPLPAIANPPGEPPTRDQTTGAPQEGAPLTAGCDVPHATPPTTAAKTARLPSVLSGR